MNNCKINLLSLSPDGALEESPELELLFGLFSRNNYFGNIPFNKLNYGMYLTNPDNIDSSVMFNKIDILIEFGFLNKTISEVDNVELISITENGNNFCNLIEKHKLLLDRDLNRNEKNDNQLDIDYKLHSAIENLDMDLVKGLLSDGADLEKKNDDGKTLLNEICSDMSYSIKSNFKKSSSPIKSDCKVDDVYNLRLKRVNALLNLGANVNTFDNERMTPLLNALHLGDGINVLKTLIEHGAKIDQELFYGLINSKHFSPEYTKLLSENEKYILR